MSDEEELELTYDVVLPVGAAEILEHDYWTYTGLTAAMLTGVRGPVKFSAAVSVFVSKGSCDVAINLRPYRVKGPSVVNIHAGEIVQLQSLSDDFEASFLVMSKSFVRSMFMYIHDIRSLAAVNAVSVAHIPASMAQAFMEFYGDLAILARAPSRPERDKAVLFTVLAFYFRTAKDAYDPYINDDGQQTRLSDRFLLLVEENFRTERFLDFYAKKLGVTPKHLSRTIKSQTGQTAVEWIEQFVILEAKVLLKSSNLNVQQISELLHFPSQSFFGKYFKKYTGISPREFRNQ